MAIGAVTRLCRGGGQLFLLGNRMGLFRSDHWPWELVRRTKLRIFCIVHCTELSSVCYKTLQNIPYERNWEFQTKVSNKVKMLLSVINCLKMIQSLCNWETMLRNRNEDYDQIRRMIKREYYYSTVFTGRSKFAQAVVVPWNTPWTLPSISCLGYYIGRKLVICTGGIRWAGYVARKGWGEGTHTAFGQETLWK
jgi:hypothetical protein